MDFNFTEEQQMLRDSARRFMRDEYDFHHVVRPTKATAPGYSERHWQQYAEFGWLGLGLPEDVDGLGCSFVETSLVLEALGGSLALEPYVSTVLLCGTLIDRSGNDALRQALLPAMVSGQHKLALAHNEPDRRFSLDVLPTTVASESRGGWSLSGSKLLALHAGTADSLIVTASLQGELALLVVDAASPGLSLNEYPLIDGTRAADVLLHDVQVPAGALLARGTAAQALLEEAVDRAVLGMCAEAIGAIEAILTLTSDYLKTRKQFGQTIGSFQALQHRMAEMFIEAQEARSSFYRGIAHLDAAPEVRKAAISSTKVVVSQAAQFVSSQGIQLHGGIGCTDEYQVGHYYQKLLGFERLFGDTDFHVDRYAAAMA